MGVNNDRAQTCSPPPWLDLHYAPGKNSVSFFTIYSIYFACQSVCLSVSFNPINDKTSEPIGPKFYAWDLTASLKITKICVQKLSIFLKF